MYSSMPHLIASLIVGLLLFALLEPTVCTKNRTTKLLNRSNRANIQDNVRNDTENSFEFIQSTNSSSNDTDARKSENLHLLTRLIDRLHQIHNRHHHHHLHHISSSSSNSIFNRPFRLFDRQTDDSFAARDFDNSFAGGGGNFDGGGGDLPFRRPMFNRMPMNGGGGGGGFNRPPQFGNGRPWLRRQRRSSLDDNLDNGIDEYLEQFNYKKIKLNNHPSSKLLTNSTTNHQSSIASSSIVNKETPFKPIHTSKLKSQSTNLSSRSAFVYNHLNPLSSSFNSKLKSPSIITSNTKSSSSLKFNSPLTTPSSNSQFLTTSASTSNNQAHSNGNLFNPLSPFSSFSSFSLFNSIDSVDKANSYGLYAPGIGSAYDGGSAYDSAHHHYYHQAYLLYKYFKLYKDKSLNEINWSALPDEIRDKFKMLILSLRYAKSENANNVNSNNSNNLNALDNWNEDYVISKALEIVKWKGWDSKKSAKKKEEYEMNRSYLKPFVPINQHSQSISHLNNQLINRQQSADLINKPILDNAFNTPGKHRNQTRKVELKDVIKLQNSVQPSPAPPTTNQQNIIDQIDDIDTGNAYSNGYSDDKYSNTIANNYQNTIRNTYSPSYLNKASSTTVSPLTTTMSTNEALKKAFENIEDIRTNHSCSKPRGRLFNLKEMNSDYRFYLPKYVFLTKCDDQSGCCSGQKHCEASEQKVITKYFYNLSSDKRQSRVVRLEFVNDTKCECREPDMIHHSIADNKNKLNNQMIKKDEQKKIIRNR